MSAQAPKGKKRTLSKANMRSLGLEEEDSGRRSGYASSVGYPTGDEDDGYDTPVFDDIFSQDFSQDSQGLVVSPTGRFFLEDAESYSPPEKKKKGTPPESPEKEGAKTQDESVLSHSTSGAKPTANTEEKEEGAVAVAASASASAKTLSPQKPKKKGGRRKKRRKTKKKRKSRKKKNKRKTKKKRRRRKK